MHYLYPATIETEDGEVIVTFADVPGALAFGASHRPALTEAREALGAMLLHMAARGEALPAPSPAKGRPLVAPPAPVAVKLALIAAFAEAGISRTELARLIDRDEAVARRLLDPGHASRLEAMEQALAALGRTLVIETRAA